MTRAAPGAPSWRRAWKKEGGVPSSVAGRVRSWKLGLLIAGGVGAVFMHVWIRLTVLRVGYALSDARQVVRKLENEHGTLETQWAALTSPARLEALAGARLGLRRPLPQQVVTLP